MNPSRQPVLSHARLWAAVDALAGRHGLTPSGLARKAGLDATTFNRSKRFGSDGRPRWPSMESIAKVLDATGASLADFFALLSGDGVEALQPVLAVPIVGSRQAGLPGFCDRDGEQPGLGRVAVPGAHAGPVFALEVVGDEFDPLYRDGDVIVVAADGEVRRGDRVIVRHRDGRLAARVLRRDTLGTLEFDGPDPATSASVARADIVWLGRVVWASQ